MLPETVILLNFHEHADAVLPRDDADGLVDLHVTTGLTLPPVVQALGGRGRDFSSAHAFVAEEQTAGQTLLQRDCTIEALLSFDVATAPSASAIIARGRKGSSAERVQWGLRLSKSGSDANLQMFWQTAAGTDVNATAVLFTPPSGFFVVAAIREWVSTTDVRVTYVVNGKTLSTVTATSGDIGNGSGGTTTVGCIGNGSGGFTDYYDGIISAIRVSSIARAPEELEHEYRRIAYHQPRGYDIIRALAPPGSPRPVYSSSPDSIVQRELMVEGDALGYAYSKAEQLRDMLPDRAYGAPLEQWERILAQVPAPGAHDTLATRRARVLDHEQNLRGWNDVDVRAALAPLLAQTTAAVDIRRFNDLRTYNFTSVPAEWLQYVGNGAIAGSGVRTLSCAGGSDIRWDEDHRNAVLMLLAMSGQASDGADISVKVSSWSGGIASTVTAGLAFFDYRTQELLIVGVSRLSNTERLAALRFTDGAVTVTVIETPYSDATSYLRLTYLGAGLYRLRWDAASYDGPYDGDVADIVGPVNPQFCGLALAATGASIAATSVTFDDFRVWERSGTRALNLYIYRDPLLSGSPDLLSARGVLSRLAHAHVNAQVTDVLQLVLGTTGLGHAPFDAT